MHRDKGKCKRDIGRDREGEGEEIIRERSSVSSINVEVIIE